MKFKVLGINFLGHDTSASLMVDGIPIACCEEERYNGEKHTRKFPINAINDCLKKSNLTLKDLDEVVFTDDPNIFKLKSKDDFRTRQLNVEDDYKKVLKNELNYSGSIKFLSHHMCHNASVYYPSGFKDALLMSNDGVGEIHSSSLAIGINGEIKIIHEGNKWPHSLGLLYSAITYYLGWRPHYDEGIIMGLASFGNDNQLVPNSNKTYKEIFKEIVYETGDFDIEINTNWVAFHRVRDEWVSDSFRKLFGPKRKWEDEITSVHKNIACALQKRLEEIVLNQLKRAKDMTGMTKLCISGGVGLNCSLNGKIEKSGMFDEIFVQPASGDAGTSLGACYMTTMLKLGELKPKKWHNFYLGSEFSYDEIEMVLRQSNLQYSRLNEDYTEVANFLKNRNIIAWFQESSEFGPRALGNRSILAAPFPILMKDYINARVKFREEFRPFAPAILSKYVNEYFDISQESPHMLIACKIKEGKRDLIPAVIHVDDSARVQTVSSNNNFRFNKLLKFFYNLTDCPVLLNTSFNVKGQPIVNTPEQAIECFLLTKIDFLVMGDFLVEK